MFCSQSRYTHISSNNFTLWQSFVIINTGEVYCMSSFLIIPQFTKVPRVIFTLIHFPLVLHVEHVIVWPFLRNIHACVLVSQYDNQSFGNNSLSLSLSLTIIIIPCDPTEFFTSHSQKKNLPIYRPIAQHGIAQMPFVLHVLLYFVEHQNQNTDAMTYSSRHDYCRQSSVLYLQIKMNKISDTHNEMLS